MKYKHPLPPFAILLFIAIKMNTIQMLIKYKSVIHIQSKNFSSGNKIIKNI